MTLPFKTHPLLSADGIVHGFFGREGGVSIGTYSSLNIAEGSHDDPDSVRENRRRVARAIGTDDTPLLSLWQHHSTDVLVIDKPWDGPKPKADGMVTQTPGIALSVLAADCGPVLFHDPVTQTIGTCHAGWRGALNGVTDKTIDVMVGLGADRTTIRAVLGPCISQQSYEVGAEFRDTFVAEDERYDRFFKQGPNARPHFDLKRFILARLRMAGLSHIEALTDCTYALPETYFSYRYNTHHNLGDYGRNVSVLMLTQ